MAQPENPHLPLDSTIYSVTELLQAGYIIVQLRAVDVPVSSLHAAGVTAHAMLLAGYSREELRDGGYSAHEMYQDSVSVPEIKAPGYTPAEVHGVLEFFDELTAAARLMQQQRLVQAYTAAWER